MSTIVTRAGKGSPLTNNEVDANFVNLNTDKIESITSVDGSVVISATGTTRDLSVGIAGSTGTLISQVRNETGATLTKGTVVYISGAGGNKALVSKALANADATSAQTYGVIQADISNNQNGYVVVVGAVSGLNTIAYPDGTQLYLSGTTAGTYTSTKPYAPIHLVYVGVVTYSHANQGTIQVKIQNGYEMDELHNVSAQSPSNGNTLVYNTSTSLWESTSTLSGSYTLSGGTANGVTYLNGSKVLTSGSALTFDGSTLNINQALNVTDGTDTLRSVVSGGIAYFGSSTNAPVAFRINSTEAMRLTSTSLYTASGINLGLGTNNPSSILTVAVDDSTGTLGPRVVGVTDPNKQLRLSYNTTSNYANIQSIHVGTAYTDLVLQKDGGNVGIGTTSLTYRFQVNSGSTATSALFSSTATPTYSATSYNGSSAKLQLVGGNATNAFNAINFTQGGSFELLVGGVQNSAGAGYADFVIQGYGRKYDGNTETYFQRLKVDDRGNLLLNYGGTGFLNGGVIADEGQFTGIRFYGNADGNLNIFNRNTTPSYGNIIVTSGNQETARFTTSGRLGVGTNDPAYKLDVLGGSGSIATTRVWNGSVGGSDGAQLLLGNSANYTNAYFRLNGGGNTSQAGAGSLNIGVSEAVPMAFYTANVERGRFSSTGLNVTGAITENSVAVVTQSDIGSAPNEIPLNQYLGSLAYQNGDAYYNTGMTVGFRNRIINGQMQIDQRNAGASVTPTSEGFYTLDRWYASLSVTSKFSVQQNAGSVTPPVGFTNYLGVTSLSAYSLSSGDYFSIRQKIEGFNIADLGWGTANAKPITLSFQVYSSLTGTFGGVINNSAQNRSYPFTYTISSANTWNSISIVITGDTTGTWLTTNGIGIGIQFSLGVGSTYSGPAGNWSGTNYISATGATSVVSTNGATFYITGVQLEKGNIATSFDVRPYGTELALCQRYYWKNIVANGTYTTLMTGGIGYDTTHIGQLYCKFPVSMRTQPTATINTLHWWNGSTGGITAIDNSNNSVDIGCLNLTTTGITVGSAYNIIPLTSGGFVAFSAEL